tara:strand:+ start:2491 stop:2985 length:495 start_codon:yes stop_codon:yes gene_type:complete
MVSNLKVDKIQSVAGNTTAMTIDSSGRVTRNVIPSFRAFKSSDGNITYSGGANISADMDTTTFNVGNCFSTSTGKFTAPVTGLYYFMAHLYNNSSGPKRVYIMFEGTHTTNMLGQSHTEAPNSFQNSGIINLTANDTCYVTCAYNDTIIYHHQTHSIFSGYLIG